MTAAASLRKEIQGYIAKMPEPNRLISWNLQTRKKSK
jgi:hypothetical protein